ncbi:hypothetical protein [Salinivibrio kushneri]|uniref:Uncharacterized protein n=1 Tax=Salinivibrio kushneri TaxID=1908198 RepID=A0AA47KM89_9GAMM|nr:hypothetical protein [Salinivibrio kushneri]WBA09575.1 hypothetical protein N8M53_05100 [Salinivibrio kushneri]
MYLDFSQIDIPEFPSKDDAMEWALSFTGIRMWHATRMLDSEKESLTRIGLKLPNKTNLDAKLIDWIKCNKSWYTKEVDCVVKKQELNRGEPPAVYAVLLKSDLSFMGIDHYAEYGSEYWQYLMRVLSNSGYGVGREELIEYGSSYLVGLQVAWKSLDPAEVTYIVDAVFENDAHNSGIAIFRDVPASEIVVVEKC